MPILRNLLGAAALILHHLLGEKTDPNLTVCICRNCHAQIHDEDFLRAGVSMELITDPKRRELNIRRALSVHMERLAQILQPYLPWFRPMSRELRNKIHLFLKKTEGILKEKKL